MPTFPKLAEYLSQLPHGVDSYPEVLTNSAVAKALLNSLSLKQAHPELPAPLNAYFTSPLLGRWMPNVHLFSLICIGFDLLFKLPGDGAARDKWIYDFNRELLGGPFYRLLFKVVSPQIVFAGIQKRWSLVNSSAVTLRVVDKAPNASTFEIRYPPGLMTQALVPHVFPQVFRCVLEMAGGKDVFSNGLVLDRESSRYTMRWK